MELQFEGPLIGQCQMNLFLSWVFLFSPSDSFLKLIYTLANVVKKFTMHFLFEAKRKFKTCHFTLDRCIYLYNVFLNDKFS